MHPISGEMCLHKERFLGLDIKTGLLNVYLGQITSSWVMSLYFCLPLQRLCASFWNKMWDTALFVVVAKYLHWPVSITYSEHIFNLAEYSADVKQLDILKYGVGFLLLFWIHCCETHTASDTEDEEWDVLAVESEELITWRRRHLEYEFQGTVVSPKSPEDYQWDRHWVKAKARYSTEKSISHHLMVLLSKGVLFIFLFSYIPCVWWNKNSFGERTRKSLCGEVEGLFPGSEVLPS